MKVIVYESTMRLKDWIAFSLRFNSFRKFRCTGLWMCSVIDSQRSLSICPPSRKYRLNHGIITE